MLVNVLNDNVYKLTTLGTGETTDDSNWEIFSTNSSGSGTGERGPQGFQGPQGPIGLQGDVGIQGERGPQGHKGEDSTIEGHQGPQGLKDLKEIHSLKEKVLRYHQQMPPILFMHKDFTTSCCKKIRTFI